jgi:hypothetical protein
MNLVAVTNFSTWMPAEITLQICFDVMNSMYEAVCCMGLAACPSCSVNNATALLLYGCTHGRPAVTAAEQLDDLCCSARFLITLTVAVTHRCLSQKKTVSLLNASTHTNVKILAWRSIMSTFVEVPSKVMPL